MGFVLGLISSACKALFRLLTYILIRSRLWIALAVYLLGWLIFPTEYKYHDPTTQMTMAIIGLTLTGLFWGCSYKKNTGE